MAAIANPDEYGAISSFDPGHPNFIMGVVRAVDLLNVLFGRGSR
jgi:hypothetical protein